MLTNTFKKHSQITEQFGKRLLGFLFLFLILLTGSIASFAQTGEERREQVVELAYDEVSGKLLDKFVTLKLSPQCWDRMLKGDGKDTINRISTNIMEHAKIMGYGDLGNVGGGSQINWDKVNLIFGKMNGKFSYTIVAGQTACSKDQWETISRFAYYVSEFYSNSTILSGMGYGWRPRAGKMLVTTIFSPTATDASVAISADGANFTVTIPSGEVDQFKWDGWQRKIETGMAKGGSKVAED